MGAAVTHTIIYGKSVVENDIPSIPARNRGQIKRAIDERLTADPLGMGKPLSGQWRGFRRLRVGDWRVIYRVVDMTVYIHVIGIRRDVYER